MLAKLFGSKARVKILKLFIHHPDDKFYIRQLARELNLQLNSVRRELENLENFGFLISSIGEESPDDTHEFQDLTIEIPKRKKDKSKKKNTEEKPLKNEKKYYQVNEDFVLFNEIKELIIKSQILYERDFIDKILKIGKIRLFLLTGFFVNQYDSPIDLLVIGNVNKKELITIITDLEKELGREVNFTLMSSNEYRYRKDMTDVFLYNILERKKIVIIDDFGLSS
jgi:hypothetical protein